MHAHTPTHAQSIQIHMHTHTRTLQESDSTDDSADGAWESGEDSVGEDTDDEDDELPAGFSMWDPLDPALPDGLPVITAIYLIFRHGARNRLSKKAVAENFDVHRALYPTHALPPYSTCRKLMMELAGVRRTDYDMCVSGCVLFRNAPQKHDPEGKHKLLNATHCPTCTLARWDAQHRPTGQKYSHLDLIPQLEALFWNEE